jgi:ubiquinol-cytochrome c reductase iron-sulfur subunit
MSRAKDWLVTAALLLAGRLARRRPEPEPEERERIVAPAVPGRCAETAVVVLLLAAAVCSVGFVVVYALDRLPSQTQLLGLALGLAFALLAAACVVTAKRVVATEHLEHGYPPLAHPPDQAELEQILEESGDRLTRKRLLVLAAGTAGGALGLALLTPAVSLGPVFDMDPYYRTPWRRGRRLVDERGRALRADEIEEGTLYTAYPEGAPRETFGAPLVVVRLEPARLELPDGRADWAPEGILAYSKICTHAGCAVALYRSPLFEPVEAPPAFVCPCHYSTFDPATGGTVTFGPAGRPLPQLPLLVAGGGELQAGGNFSGPVGPSWWGVQMNPPRST